MDDHEAMITVDKMREKYEDYIKELNAEIEHHRERVLDRERLNEIRYRDGMIDGLKFAIRCNGVSGGEVRS